MAIYLISAAHTIVINFPHYLACEWGQSRTFWTWKCKWKIFALEKLASDKSSNLNHHHTLTSDKIIKIIIHGSVNC